MGINNKIFIGMFMIVVLAGFSLGVIAATGGTITYYHNGSVNFTIHTFTSSGTFTVTNQGDVEYLIIGGGGGGGGYCGGGGGGGEVVSNTSYPVGTSAYPIFVGLGGFGGGKAWVNGGKGENSSFGNIVAVGGGGGKQYDGGDSGNGYVGGIAYTTGRVLGGGGGGGSSAGYNPPNTVIGGQGGTGVESSISGVSKRYAGGGGGGTYVVTSGVLTGGTGVDGGGDGGGCRGTYNGIAGENNTGGGGGGGSYGAGGGYGRDGGSGTVIIRYLTVAGSTVTEPTYSNFTSTDTTNFSAVDVTNVTSMTLAKTGKGKIKFPESTEINAEAQDYDTNIIIEDEFISVNTAALDESFNTSATITLEGVTCPVATITYQEGTFTSKDDIITGGKNCELEGVCSNIQCIGTTLTFDVAHFTGFAAGADANLTTEAQAGVFYPLDPIEFTAEYINSTDGTPISGECNITFDDDWDTEYTMDFDTDYNYTKSFATSGLHEYNVTCSSANFVTLEANDTKLVSSVDIPEFSIMTLGIGLMIILIGLFIIRKKK